MKLSKPKASSMRPSTTRSDLASHGLEADLLGKSGSHHFHSADDS